MKRLSPFLAALIIAVVSLCAGSHPASTATYPYAYPIGPAGGSLAGTYPNPTVSSGALTLAGDATGAANANTVTSLSSGSPIPLTTGISFGSPTSHATGAIRAANGATVASAENAAASGQLSLLSTDAANNIYVAFGPGQVRIGDSTGAVELLSGALTVTSSSVTSSKLTQTSDGAWIQTLWNGAANTQASQNFRYGFRCRTIAQTPQTCFSFSVNPHHGATIVFTASGRTIVGGGAPWTAVDSVMGCQYHADVYYDGTTGTIMDQGYIINGSVAGTCDVSMSTNTVNLRVDSAPVSGGSNPTVDWQGEALVVAN